MNGSTGEWFRTTVRVRHRGLVSPTTVLEMIKGQKLGTVTSILIFEQLLQLTAQKSEVLSRSSKGTAPSTKLKPVWRDINISLKTKVYLMCSLVISTFLYACESLTLTAEKERRMQVL